MVSTGVVDDGIGSGVVPKIVLVKPGIGLGGDCGMVGFHQGRGL